MDVSLIISSLGAAKDMAGALIGERDRQKAAVIEANLTEKILQAQAQLAQVLAAVIDKDAAIRVLTERVRELEAAQNERARYQLAKLGVVGDFFAYRLRPASELSERADEPEHFLCQPCFDAGKKSVLRVRKYQADCPVCKSSFAVAKRPLTSRTVGTAGGWMGG